MTTTLFQIAPNACCPTPKIFVGQVPCEASQEDVQQIFSLHGPCTSILLTGDDGRSKGCAMVVYESWADAERAIEEKHGKLPFGGRKPLSVRIAAPPKGTIGITPKKLFVGRVPSTCKDSDIRQIFETFGDIIECAVLRKQEASDCAFVTYSKWSECEAAIIKLNGSKALDENDAITVKFADAKLDPIDPLNPQPLESTPTPPPQPSTSGSNSQTSGHFHNRGRQGKGGRESVSVTSNPSTSRKAYPATSTSMTSAYMGYGGLGGSYGGLGYDPMLAFMMPHSLYPRAYGGGLGLGLGMGMGLGQGPMVGVMMNGMTAHMNMMHMNGMMVRGGGGGMMMGQYQGGGNEAFQAPGTSHLHQYQQGVTTTMAQGAKGNKDLLAREWKLFIGQVPFSSTENNLWPIFAPFGNILELIVLRSQGRSKGCAFLTYESKEMADAAIEAVDGKITLPNDPKQRMITVKYADPPAYPFIKPTPPPPVSTLDENGAASTSTT